MPGCALTQGYVLDCQKSSGGSKEFYIIEFANVESATVTAGVVTALTKATGKAFYKYEQVRSTSEVVEDWQQNEENGTAFSKQTVKLVLNRKQTAVRNEIMLLSKNRLIIIEVDRNGEAWMYGRQYGMTLGASQAKSGKAPGDRNGYELTFDGMENELAENVDASVVTALLTPGT